MNHMDAKLTHLQGIDKLLGRRRAIAVDAIHELQRVVLDEVVHHGLEVVAFVAAIDGHDGCCAHRLRAEIVVPAPPLLEPLRRARHDLAGGDGPPSDNRMVAVPRILRGGAAVHVGMVQRVRVRTDAWLSSKTRHRANDGAPNGKQSLGVSTQLANSPARSEIN